MGMPCVPAPIKWLMVFENQIKVNFAKPLLEDSFVMCGLGGKIEIHFSRAAAAAASEAHVAEQKAQAAEERAREAKEVAGVLFWVGIGAAVVVGVAAIVFTGGAAAPAVAVAAKAIAIGAGVGATVGGVAGGIENGWEGVPGGMLQGAKYGAAGGAASLIPVAAAAAAPFMTASLMTYGVGVANDGIAVYHAPNEQRVRTLVAGVVVVGSGFVIRKLHQKVKGSPLIIENVLNNPKSLWGKTPNQIASAFENAGYKANIKQSVKGSGKAVIIEVNHPKITRIQVHPGGGRHVGSYYKISTNNIGKVKVVDPKTYKHTPGEKTKIIDKNTGREIVY